MLHFELCNRNLSKVDIIPSFIIINNKNINQHIEIISQCIDLFHKEINWNGMFDLNEARKRTKLGDIMYIGIEHNSPFGYFWVKNIDTKYFLYNVFVVSKRKDIKYTGRHLLHAVIQTFDPDKSCFAHIDEWNIKSINLFKKLGFILKS